VNTRSRIARQQQGGVLFTKADRMNVNLGQSVLDNVTL